MNNSGITVTRVIRLHYAFAATRRVSTRRLRIVSLGCVGSSSPTSSAPTYELDAAIAVMLEKHGVGCDMMHGFQRDKWTSGKPVEQLALIPAGQEHILRQDDGKKCWVQVVTEPFPAFALCAASDESHGDSR